MALSVLIANQEKSSENSISQNYGFNCFLGKRSTSKQIFFILYHALNLPFMTKLSMVFICELRASETL